MYKTNTLNNQKLINLDQKEIKEKNIIHENLNLQYSFKINIIMFKLK
jgi:hypothetical protein